MFVRHREFRGPGRQRGIATLLFSLLVMILVTYVVLYTSGSVLLEQQIVNNDVRSKHAFEAAEAGIATAKKYLTIGADRNNDGTIDAVFDTNADDIGDSNTVAIGNGNVIVNTTDVSTGGDAVRIGDWAQSLGRGTNHIDGPQSLASVFVKPVTFTTETPVLKARASIVIMATVIALRSSRVNAARCNLFVCRCL